LQLNCTKQSDIFFLTGSYKQCKSSRFWKHIGSILKAGVNVKEGTLEFVPKQIDETKMGQPRSPKKLGDLPTIQTKLHLD
jgi:hypothetical protein